MGIALAWLFVALLLVAASYRAAYLVAYLLRRRPAETEPTRLRRFAVVIPAHDEELLIGHAIDSLRATDYPRELLEIHVIADNCSDGTAEKARALGERVAERHDPERRGKGQALGWLFERLDLQNADAVAIFDADNLVDPGFFRAMNRALDAGARCLQGYNDIANPAESVMTRMLAVTYVMRNLLFNGGKAALGLSVMLGGTGMVFAREVILGGGWTATTIGEDLEQTFKLLERGECVVFVAEARTRAQESTNLRQGYTQRQRWESGRLALHGTALRAVANGLREGSIRRAECGVDLLMPSYATFVNLSLVGLVLALVLRPSSPGLLVAVGGVLAYQAVEIAVGLVLMRATPRFLAALAFAPVFLVWRGVIDVLALFGRRRDRWTRTARIRHSGPEAGSPSARPRD